MPFIDLPNDKLKELWSCNWSVEKINKILQQHLASVQTFHDNDESLLFHAIQLVLVFLQNNFTGPFAQLEQLERCRNQIFPKEYIAAHQLISNGEEINTNVNLPELFAKAKDIIQHLLEKRPSSLVKSYFKMYMK